MEFQHAYSEPFRGSDLHCKDKSLAQQQFADDADINVLLERFKVTGQMPAAVSLPQYGDFSSVMDFRTAQDALLKAKNAFMELPAKIRARFKNDPQELLEFVSDPKNRAEATELGLFKAAPEPVVQDVRVVGGIGGAAPDVSLADAATGAKKP